MQIYGNTINFMSVPSYKWRAWQRRASNLMSIEENRLLKEGYSIEEALRISGAKVAKMLENDPEPAKYYSKDDKSIYWQLYAAPNDRIRKECETNGDFTRLRTALPLSYDEIVHACMTGKFKNRKLNAYPRKYKERGRI